MNRFERILTDKLAEIEARGALKGNEKVITAVLPPENGKGPRYIIEGQEDRTFIRMNANAYLGLARDEGMVHAEEAARDLRRRDRPEDDRDRLADRLVEDPQLV